MQIIISPAKKMIENTDTLPPLRMPLFLNEANIILSKIREFDFAKLKALYKASDSIVKQNLERLSCMDLSKNLTPALLSYSGLQYQSMGANVFDERSYEYLDRHLFILSAMYGMLRPFDGVRAYRLEMAAKLKINDKKDLYDFWQKKVTGELQKYDDTVINLASEEYSKVIDSKKVNLINVLFPVKSGDKLVERGSLCKQARGAMVRFLAENNIESSEEMKYFSAYGFVYSKEHSNKKTFCFIKENNYGNA